MPRRGGWFKDNAISQVLLESTKSEDDIDNWLYQYSNCEYIGVTENKRG